MGLADRYERDGFVSPVDIVTALHSSLPNHSNDRRIGLNIQYITPEVRQTKLPGYTARLVRGEDRFHHYPADIPAASDLDAVAMKRRDQLEDLHVRIAGRD